MTFGVSPKVTQKVRVQVATNDAGTPEGYRVRKLLLWAAFSFLILGYSISADLSVFGNLQSRVKAMFEAPKCLLKSVLEASQSVPITKSLLPPSRKNGPNSSRKSGSITKTRFARSRFFPDFQYKIALCPATSEFRYGQICLGFPKGGGGCEGGESQ